MPICKKCNNKFPSSKKINGKARNLGNRKYCLDCSPFGARNNRKLEKKKLPEEKFCGWCGEIKPKNEFYLRTDREGLSCYCKKCSNKSNGGGQNKRAETRKIKLVNMKGGKCEICGYDKNLSVLNFHHKDPKTKLFPLDKRTIRTISWKKCVEEAKKCQLLCANCHMEFHSPSQNEWKNYDLNPGPKPKATPVENFCIDCSAPTYRHAKRCKKCNREKSTKIQWPDDKSLSKLVWEIPRAQLAKQLKVSDKAISKRCKRHGINQPARGYWSKKAAGKI